MSRRILLPFIVLIACLASNPASAQREHPIDIQLAERLEGAMTTVDQIEAVSEAAEAWDALLNRNYRDLISVLPHGAADRLRAAQRSWLQFRDSEYAALDALYAGMQGTMYLPMRDMDRMQIVKERALHLETRLDLWRSR